MKKLLFVIFIGLSSCADLEQPCLSNCWEVVQNGNLGAMMVNTCNGTSMDYMYPLNTKDSERYKVGEIVCF